MVAYLTRWSVSIAVQIIIKSYQTIFFFFKLGFTPCKAEQPLQGMELQEKETLKD